IEHTNRDTTIVPGPDGVIDAADPTRANRFNVPDAFIPASIPPANQLNPPDSYGYLSGTSPFSQPRGIGTLPGAIPVVKNNTIAGGIGVFFPGKTGFATEENSQTVKNTLFDPGKPDRSLEAEYIAFAALGGSQGSGYTFGALGGIDPVPGISLPFGRIDLV